MLFAADYSQVELRVLAHMSGDEKLISAFLGDEDIHRATAAFLNNIEPELVTSNMRAMAKRVNFGIIHGLSEFGLARDTGLPREVAAAFHRQYLDKYAGVRTYIEETAAHARQHVVATLSGRRRSMPDIYSANWNVQQARRACHHQYAHSGHRRRTSSSRR